MKVYFSQLYTEVASTRGRWFAWVAFIFERAILPLSGTWWIGEDLGFLCDQSDNWKYVS